MILISLLGNLDARKMKIVECVPNFSEGRRTEVINEISNAAAAVPGLTILDCESDPNHNRMVLTFVGSPESVVKAALASSERAIALIDLTKHTGEHPRMGAVDVVPFVPLNDVTMDECVQLANEFGREYASRFSVPVFLYESAARVPERKNLADVRQGQFEGLRELIGTDPTRVPDYGPNKIHPTAGATAVGARPVLIAYNVDLNTQDLSVAKKIAKKIRERDGGLPAIKALGFELKDRGIVQVSMNLTDYTRTSMHQAFDEISKLTRESNVTIVDSEIVGLVPQDAITRASMHYLLLRNFSQDQVIENRIFGADLRAPNKSLVSLSLEEFSDRVQSKSPTPGGGSVAAYAGALAASLVSMVCQLTVGRKKYESAWNEASKILSEATALRTRLLALVDMDAAAYDQVSAAIKMPKETEDEKNEQRKKLNAALISAARVPTETVELSNNLFLLAQRMRVIGNKNASSDADTAVQMARASVISGYKNVIVNLEGLEGQQDAGFIKETFDKLEPIYREVLGFQG